MGIGLEETIRIDTNAEPYKSSNSRRSFVPTGNILIQEILRRAVSFGLPVSKLPKPENWVNKKRLTWLKNNPILAPGEIDFVTLEIVAFDDLFKAGTTERQNDIAPTQSKDAWNGPLPYLQLYHVLMEDEVRIAFLDQYKAKERAKLDGRNSSECPPPQHL
jgi:hypothetical protein